MKQRMDMQQVVPGGYKAILGIESYLLTTSLQPLHKELIKIRASQLNGCAFCLNMHTVDARMLGETDQRMHLMSVWRETSLFTEEEQAILALTEEVTFIAQHVSEATYNRALELLGEQYLAEVIMAIIAINAWNRVAITTRMTIG